MDVQDIQRAIARIYAKKERELHFFGDYEVGYKCAVDDILAWIDSDKDWTKAKPLKEFSLPKGD